MKNEELVAALIADHGTRGRSIARSLLLALVAGCALSLVAFFIGLGVRADIVPALATWRFDLKVVMVLLAVVLSFALCLDCARPDMSRHPLRRLLPMLALLAGAIVMELAVVPASAWERQLIGTNSMVCLTAMPVLSLAPLAGVLFILRRGAPASPALAGAAAGFLAAVCGASLYAFHCFDDSPLFVATWYTLAAIPMVAIGALAGHRLLRW